MSPSWFFPRVLELSVALSILAPGAFAQVSIVPVGGASVLDGESPHLIVTGLKPGEMATVHAFRQTEAYDPSDYTAMAVVADAEAVFVADGTGKIAVDSTAPIRGTYSGIDPLGLLWSGTRVAHDTSPKPAITQALHLQNSADIYFRVEAPSLGVGKWAETVIKLSDGADMLDLETVSLPGLNGVFCTTESQNH